MRWDDEFADADDPWAAYERMMSGETDRRRDPPPTPNLDTLDLVIGADAVQTWNPRTRGIDRGERGPRGGVIRSYGGEWDHIRTKTTATQRRRLTSAGFMRSDGMTPDDFADLIERNGAQHLGGREPLEWFVVTALVAISERQRLTRFEREHRLIQRTGHDTLFAYRNARAVTLGFRSFFAYRIAMGWGDGHGRHRLTPTSNDA